jgi:hypothetical protein
MDLRSKPGLGPCIVNPKKNLHSRIIGTRLGLRGGGASRRTQRFDLIYVLRELICDMLLFFFVLPSLCVMFPFFVRNMNAASAANAFLARE